MCNCASAENQGVSDIHIQRGIRGCLSLRGGKFEGQDCEISNEYESHAFFMFCSY